MKQRRKMSACPDSGESGHRPIARSGLADAPNCGNLTVELLNRTDRAPMLVAMWPLLVRLLLISLAAWIVAELVRGQYVFAIRVSEGRPHVRRGRVTPAFLGAVAVACERRHSHGGWIGGPMRETWMRLRFARHFPGDFRQQLRNEWRFIG